MFDTSGSMGEVYVEGIEKMRAAKSFFYTFADRALGFNLKAVISLILFSNSITVKCQFTERFRSFKRHVEVITPSGGTNMYDAMLQTAEKLALFGSEYPKATKRIIVFSDGEDTGSQHSEFDAAKGLREKNVLMDSVVVGTKNLELKAISFSTGGCSYFFSGLEEGVQLFENETFVKSTLRVKETIPILNSINDLELLKKKPYANSPPELVVNPHLAQKVVDPSK
jgi:Mg-chelatase subunit ChlD